MSDIRVQRGFLDASDGGTSNPPLAFGSLNSTFVLMNNNRMQSAGPSGSSGNQSAADMSGGVELTNTTTITHRRTLSVGRQYWEAWEYRGSVGGPHEFIVRDRIVVSMTTTQQDVTISGVVDADRCVPFVTGITTSINSQVAYASTATAHLTSATNVRVNAQPGAGTTTVYITIVEFVGASWQVFHGNTTNGNDSGTINLFEGSDGTGTAAAITWSNAFIYGLCAAGDTSNVALADHWPRFLPNSASNCSFQYNGQHDGAHLLWAHVVQNSTMSVSRFSDAGSHQGNRGINISSAGLIALDAAASFVTRQSSGTGTAYGRNWVSSELSSLTNLNLWAHRTGNTIATEIQVVDLSSLSTIGVVDVDGDNQVTSTQTGVVLSGFGFGAVQGTGFVEIWDDAAGTTRVLQSIVSWSDASITFDVSIGSITDGSRFIIVRSDVGDQTSPFPITLGPLPLPGYDEVIQALNPDHWWQLNNDAYADSGFFVDNRPMTAAVVGDGGTFEADPICDFNTHSWLADNRVAREIADSNAVNLQNITARSMGGWIRVNIICRDFSCIYKEGGSVNNMCVLIGMGNVLIAQLADTSDDNAQAYSDIKLTPGRPYHLLFRYDYGEAPAEFRLYLDGVLQEATFGNPLLATDLDSHSGDVIWAGLDTSVEVFGTDVLFSNMEDCNYAQWATWRVGLDASDIEDLFRRGALPSVTITTDTPANMQAQLDGLANTTIDDWPLAMRVEPPSGVDDLQLNADNVTFDPRCTLFLEWRGAGTLTWTNTNGTNLESSKVYASRGGSVVIQEAVPVEVTVLDINTNTPIQDARVYIEADNGGPLAQGTVIANALTNASGQISVNLDYSADQPVTGRVRKASFPPYYRTASVSETVTSDGLSTQIFLIPDE